jgi:PAS domain S-box-containing protein
MSKERILIITDDDDKNKISLNNKLKSWDYSPYYFQIKSQNYSKDIKPNLILVDINHTNPSESINNSIDIIKKFDVPLIFISKDLDVNLIKSNNLSRSYYIQKPYNDNEIKLTLELAIFHEKTDKKFLEEKNNFKMLYDRTPIPYHSLDKNGNILDVNQSWLEKLGYERPEVVGKWFGNFIGNEHVKNFESNFSKIMNNMEILTVNLDMIQKNGNRINVKIDCKAAYDLDGYFQQTHCIFVDMSEKKKAEDALKKSEQYYKTIFENTGTATIIVEEDNKISLVNTEFEKLYGYNKADIEGKKEWKQFVDKKYLPTMEKYHKARRIKPADAPRNYEFDFIDNNNTVKNIFATVAIIPGTKKSLISLQDVTERNIAEKDLKNSLKDKDMLMREIHHRVKNNLQIISSLLNLQSQYIKDKYAMDIFTDSQNRVRSMAIIHEKLYKSQSMSEIDFSDYITELVESLFYNHNVDESRIKLIKNMDKVYFNVDTAIPCGLIVNELITNCLKHAFPNDINGEVHIDLFKMEDKYVLNVKDNGVGFPDNIDYKNTDSLGLQLVTSLVNQIDGTIELSNGLGSNFKIIFKQLEYKKRS